MSNWSWNHMLSNIHIIGCKTQIPVLRNSALVVTHNPGPPTAIKPTCLAVSQTGWVMWGLDRPKQSRVHICVFKSSSRAPPRHSQKHERVSWTAIPRLESCPYGRVYSNPKSLSRTVYTGYISRLDVRSKPYIYSLRVYKKHLWAFKT
jgi:hypothetical protein